MVYLHAGQDWRFCVYTVTQWWSTVRLRFRKSISEHHYQNTKFFSKIEMLLIVYSNAFIQKKLFSSCEICYIDLWSFLCLINVLVSLLLIENFVVSLNARSILELMLCKGNSTKFDILTLLNSNCRAWALKFSKHLKKQLNRVLSSFCQLHLYRYFFALSSWI